MNMKKNVLIISTSLRNKSNSEVLADTFMKGAKDAGHQVEKVSLKGKRLEFCKGCLACQKTGHCIIQDDAGEIVKKMFHADVLVFATPIYYYEMSGQMKTLIDRANPLYATDYAFRQVYLLATAAEDDIHAMDGALKGLQGFVDCYEKLEFSGAVFAGGVDAPGEIHLHESLKRAYELGGAL